jgi:predicted small secreted protein
VKKSILTLAASALLAGAILTSCNTPAQKVENAEENVAAANEALNEANEAYQKEIDSYRREADEKIAANNKSIAEFNARIALEKKDAQDDYRRQIATLEQKNSDMKKKMDDYKAEGKDKWEKFKTEFGRDMDELGKAFKDLTVKNVK